MACAILVILLVPLAAAAAADVAVPLPRGWIGTTSQWIRGLGIAFALFNLALLAVALRDCPLPEPARATLRLAKSIELLCATFEKFANNSLIAADSAGELCERDAARLAAARRLVDERWQEKLTLDTIARACGLNRAKLTRGFRQAFGSTVADAIADRRLQGAHRLLLATDLPVSSIGYRCGYSNNASFTRAFSRRYGVAPTRLRALEVAA